MLRGYRKPCGHLVVSDKFCTFAGRLTEQTVMTIEEVAIELRRLADPIIVRELQEIDDFFDQLDPNIDVIWGTATDDTLGEDAKVTILATGLEDDLRTEVEKDAHRDEDDFYEDLIPKLYKPVKKEKPTIKEASCSSNSNISMFGIRKGCSLSFCSLSIICCSLILDASKNQGNSPKIS